MLDHEPIHRIFGRYLEQSDVRGLLNVEDANEAVDAFVGLLLGDAHTQRLLGVLDPTLRERHQGPRDADGGTTSSPVPRVARC